MADLARIAARPSPTDWGDDAPMRLEEAVAVSNITHGGSA